MIMALIAPELMVIWAMRQWISARHVTRQFEESGYPSICPEQEQPEGESCFRKLCVSLLTIHVLREGV
jgi:hypothetical protein